MKLRTEIEDKYKWDLTVFFKNEEHFEQVFNEVASEMENIKLFAGKLSDKDELLKCLKLSDEIDIKAENLYVYSRMKADEDAFVSSYQAMHQRVCALFVKYSVASAYIMPELSALSAERINELSRLPEFSDFSYMLEKVAKRKEKVLTEPEERIIAEFSEICEGYQKTFIAFDNADVKFDDVQFEGKTTSLSHGTYGLILASEDRAAREAAFNSMFGAYKQNINTLTAMYAGNVKASWVMARLRKFDSCMQYVTYYEDVPADVYTNLIKSTEQYAPIMHKYVEYRKSVLGYDKLHMWDLYCPIVSESDMKLSYEQAYEVVVEALAPLGADYQSLLRRAYNEKWIDVMESKGKRSGAYSWGTYSTHPFVLLNYQPNINNISTIAHEMGHALHSYHSDKALPHAKAEYTIFVAEVASIVNEMLLKRYLLKNATGDTKKFLLQILLDMIRTTLFRQAMFAEFEVLAHNAVEQDNPLTPDLLNDFYYNLNVKYYGKDVSDDLIKYEWARIPHFYRDFYVYKYATGIISAIAISEDIFNGKPGALEGYKKFLSAGGSMPPNEILKLAGVDLTTMAPFNKAMKFFKDTLEELISL